MKARFGSTARHGIEARLRQTRALFRSRRRLEIRHGLRISAAGVASYAVAELLNLPQAYWAVFTAVLVVQGSVGGSWKASVDRLLGTLLGAAYGAAVTSVIPHDSPVMTGLALALSLLPLSLLAAVYPAFRVAPVTAIILLLGSVGAAEGPVRAAMLRTLEVALGGICGMTISLYVFPARAHMLLGKAADTVLRQLSALFADLAGAISRAATPDRISSRHDAIHSALKSLEEIAAEAARERRSHLSEDVDPGPIARTLRRVYHDLILIGRVTSEPVIAMPSPDLQASLRKFTDSGQELLRALGMAFAQRLTPGTDQRFDAALRDLLAELQQTENRESVVALRFALLQLQQNMADLYQRALEFARTRA